MKFHEHEFTESPNNSHNKHCQNLVLAESQPIVFKPLLAQIKKTFVRVSLCSSYQELVNKCNQESPDILILGTLPEVNSLEIYRKCRSKWSQVPIILLVNQPVVNEFFQSWAIKQGITNVVSSYPQEFEQLRTTIENVTQAKGKPIQIEKIALPPVPPLEEIFSIPMPVVTVPETMELSDALEALSQLTEYSKRYFGPLVVGNYWKKAHSSVVETHPWLNQWSVDYWGKIEYLPNCPESQEVTSDRLHSLQVWTKAFLQECQRVIVDFPQLLQKKHLSPQIDRLISFSIKR